MDSKKNAKPPRGDGKTDQRFVVKSVLDALAIVPQMSLTIAIPIVLGVLAGHWLDEKFETKPVFFLILLCLGIAGSVTGVYRLIRILWKGKKD